MELNMTVEEIKNLKVVTGFCEVRAGKALTTIELTSNGKCVGKELVFRTPSEIPQLIEALVKVNEYFKAETVTPTKENV